jgi:protocatechuate 3,4-dioxygenase alpha subunit
MSKTQVLRETPSQTAGPYVHIGLAPKAAGFDIYERELGHEIAGPEAVGARIRVEGRVFDGTGTPLKDVLIEVWQADAAGAYAQAAGFRGWGRVISDFDSGDWAFETIKPGGVEGMAPHINLWIVARGINLGLNTRMYFEDEAQANATDPVLGLVPNARQSTLIARRVSDEVYQFNVHLQGADETVFFDI